MSEEKRQAPTGSDQPKRAGGYPSGASGQTIGAGQPSQGGYGYVQPPYYQQQPMSQASQPSYYQPGMQAGMPQGMQGMPGMQGVPGMLPVEESYIENILRLNRGKLATIYMTFENNDRWNAMVFKGIIEAAGRDHIIISNPETGKRHILLMIYLDYITFDEEIQYQYPYGAGAGTGQFANYPPR
ncbi:spore coat protein GerQ [Aquibacillus saliphilus]|uniref:spore coat protein GerQ n=1 Tax=Aquibacillus saliphilus TaxID=1909422 RepID=UPI001CF0541F|nr:spore coat protein GerQ [Aquibacillus saliphilus]